MNKDYQDWCRLAKLLDKWMLSSNEKNEHYQAILDECDGSIGPLFGHLNTHLSVPFIRLLEDIAGVKPYPEGSGTTIYHKIAAWLDWWDAKCVANRKIDVLEQTYEDLNEPIDEELVV